MHLPRHDNLLNWESGAEEKCVRSGGGGAKLVSCSCNFTYLCARQHHIPVRNRYGLQSTGNKYILNTIAPVQRPINGRYCTVLGSPILTHDAQPPGAHRPLYTLIPPPQHSSARLVSLSVGYALFWFLSFDILPRYLPIFATVLLCLY